MEWRLKELENHVERYGMLENHMERYGMLENHMERFRMQARNQIFRRKRQSGHFACIAARDRYFHIRPNIQDYFASSQESFPNIQVS